MIETIVIKDLQPAAYNPRLIQDDNFEELKNSLQILGIIIPILVNKKNMTIIAGHQRTKAAIDFEFDLPLPNGKSYQRNKDAWEVFKKYYASSSN